MAVEFSCPYCQQLVRTPLSAAGKKGKCPQCKAVVQIPGGAGGTSARSTAHITPSRVVAQGIPAADASKVEFYCVECGQLVRTPAAVAGKKGKCPNCQALITIPRKAAGSKSSSAVTSPYAPSNSGHGSSLVELTPLEPLTAIGPLPPPPAAPPPNLEPLLDEVLPPLAPVQSLPSLPATQWQSNPYWSNESPFPERKRRLTDLGRRGLPWERDPSTESFFETVRYVLSAPGDAFLAMHREGLGSPFGFFLVAAVFGNLLAVVIMSVVQLILGIIYIAIADPGQSLFIKWDVLFFRLAAGCCVAIGAALISGTVGGLISAVMYHTCLLVCGAANGGFATTYRVVGFGLGSIYMLASLPIVGPLFAIVMQPIVLAYGFMNAHETDGWRAFLAAVLPMLLGLCCFGFILAANWDAIAAAAQQAMERQGISSGT
jgi:phage FluMu protein Com